MSKILVYTVHGAIIIVNLYLMVYICRILAQNVNNYIVLNLWFDCVIWVRITRYIVHWFG